MNNFYVNEISQEVEKKITQKLKKDYNIFIQNIALYKGIDINEKLKNSFFNTLVLDSFYQYVILSKLLITFFQDYIKEGKVVEVIDIGTGLGVPSVPIILSFKNLEPDIIKFLSFTLLEPKKKETKFLENLKQSLSIDFQLVNNDEKYFYSKYKKKFDIVFCRAVFTPPKIFDVFKKFTKNIAFWQYSDNYRYYLQIYKGKIERNKLEILEVFKYQINNKDYFTIVFVRRDL